MTPSSSANNIVRPLSPTPQRGRPPPTLYMCVSCPEFGTCNHFGSDSGVGDDSDLVCQNQSYSRSSSASDVGVVDVVEDDGIAMVEVTIPDDESVYGTARVPQGEFTRSPRGVVIHSTYTGLPPSPSPSLSRARALAKMAGKAKSIAKMFSLRKLSRKPSMDPPIPLISSSSAVAVSGSWPEGAGEWSQVSPRRPPISILITSESMTDAVTYHMSPNARLMSSSSTTGIYTPDDDDSHHDFSGPQTPTPSPVVPQGAGAFRRLEGALIDANGDIFAEIPRGRPTTRRALSSRNTRAAPPPPAPNTDTARPSALTAVPQQAAALGSPPTPCPFPNLVRILLFMPWCIAVGATITLFPASIDAVVFSESAGYIPPPVPRGVQRFCFWADTARDYACIFAAALLSLFLVSTGVGSIACALVLARFVWVWGTYACAKGVAQGCCCVHNPERLGEDDMESLALIARGGDVANLVLRQCAEHAGARPSRQ